jgi:hypothetical protein
LPSAFATRERAGIFLILWLRYSGKRKKIKQAIAVSHIPRTVAWVSGIKRENPIVPSMNPITIPNRPKVLNKPANSPDTVYNPNVKPNILELIDGIIPTITPTMVACPAPQNQAAVRMPRRHRMELILNPAHWNPSKPITTPIPKIKNAAISSKAKELSFFFFFTVSELTIKTKLNMPAISDSKIMTISP